jgi:hypothetical protein
VRIYAPAGTRSIPTDRNPSTVAVGSDVGVAAGGTTTLATYTVPAARRADLAVQGEFAVTTVLGAAQAGHLTLRVTPSGGADTPLAGADFVVASAVGTEKQTPSVHVQLKPGDKVVVQVALDAGTGLGTAKGGVQGVEYDV